MKVLLSGGRAPYTLELVRIFGKEGHEIHILEFISSSLCSYSKYTKSTHQITSPNQNHLKFKEDLLNLLKNQNFDILIPTCEEAIYLSEIKSEIDQFTSLFTPEFELIYRLHNKELFIELLNSKGLSAPKLYGPNDKLELDKNYIVKKKLSRFGGHVKKVKGQNISDSFDFKLNIIQEMICAQEYCLYVVLCDGEITAKSIYLKQLSIDGGATNLFESVDIDVINKWVDLFFKDEKVSGQFSFDLFIKDNKVYPIECNPRTTSGVHLLRNSLSLKHFIDKKSQPAHPDFKTIYMLAIPLFLFSLSPRTLLSALNKFFKAKDVIWLASDPLPAFGQVFTLFKFYLIALRNKVNLIEATTIDIEYEHFK